MSRILRIAAAVLSFATAASAQLILRDDFNYIGPLTMNGWIAHSSGGQKQIWSQGEFARLDQGTGAGEDINRSWAPYPLTQTLWCGFRMKVPAGGAVTTTNGVYFLHFKDAGSGFRARTGIRAPGAGGNFRLAVNADGTNLSLGANWPQDLMFDTDYFVVVNWNPTTGQSQMWVNPTSPASPSVSHTGTLVGNFMVGLALRQSTEYTGFIHVDNLFVGLSFADVVGPGASYTTFGAGCANSVGVASNTADSLPRIGYTTTVTIGNVTNPAVALLLFGTSNTFSSTFGPLPLDLSPFGAPGCFGRVSDDALQMFNIGFNGVPFPLAIPNDLAFFGLTLHTQAIVFENVNALGLAFSDAATMVIGG